MKKFKKILIANRGEIAVRIIRTCREMGLIPVAVYSEVDSQALHVRLAEEAYPLGEAAPAASYLNIEKIITIAKKCQAEAIHPGYGFLAENHHFVRRCEEEGIIFIGPPSGPMELLGLKTISRQKMKEAGVPIIPGTLEPIKNEKELIEQAEAIGFPLLLKASAGGGGKGLRLVRQKEELLSAFRLAASEAQASFGDPSVYLEKYIDEPHHIEIQILVDNYGQAVYLGERECSMQRRYQKILEETPSPFIDDNIRRRMGEIAVAAARSIGYRNAGTVEFIVDKNKNFYFLEVNARLQVEHPITEMVTGIDLVRAQIEIAQGNPLPFTQEQIKPQGHAIECRIMAEDPFQNFLPSPGKILYLHRPGGPGIRDDSGIVEGYVVPIEYDALLSKLIAWGRTRDEAILRLRRALREYQIYGIKTTIPFFLRILDHPDFLAGNYNTHFLERLEKEPLVATDEDLVAVIAAAVKAYHDLKKETSAVWPTKSHPWKLMGRIELLRSRL
ncbi:MAG: acetyl-CoA carboxylase biotin carboxylase subunit [Candidatus Aminicenantes bacterium]|nr:acetyl-CoA carboxylase biotin carboxylase subunit [Candidatus Aminicenantes bacterium]